MQQQSAIQAGDGGFQVKVAGNTDLKGAVLASNQTAIDNNANSLSTASLITSDIQNHAVASASGFGINSGANIAGGNAKDGGQGQGPGGTNLMNAGNDSNVTDSKYEAGKVIAGNLLNNTSESSSSSGATRSAVSAGAVTIADANQQQELTGNTADQTVAGLKFRQNSSVRIR